MLSKRVRASPAPPPRSGAHLLAPRATSGHREAMWQESRLLPSLTRLLSQVMPNLLCLRGHCTLPQPQRLTAKCPH